MNILYIAYSCSPYSGSEGKIGWNVPWENSKNNRVFVITKESHRDNIEKYMNNHPNDNISFYFTDVPQIYKRIFKGAIYSGLLNVWHKRAFTVAKEICRKYDVQIIHQITPIEFRSIGEYKKIPNVKFVVGPLGGGEYIPTGLKSYAKGHMCTENIRKILNCFSKIKLKAANKLNECDAVMYANKETCAYLGMRGGVHTN